jgi:very-short-patch-repair endonuclease
MGGDLSTRTSHDCHAMSLKRARNLRKNATDAERKLWSAIRRRALNGHRFRRQHPLGRYIVDFVCLERRLIIELDGGQHDERAELDKARTAWLEENEYTVIRFWNNDVMINLEGCLLTIRAALQP